MQETDSGSQQVKAALRAEARARRTALDPVIRQAHGTAMAQHAWEFLAPRLPLPGPVACTWSMATEPPTDPLIGRLLQAGIAVVTPRIEGPVTMAWIPTTDQTELIAGPLGIRTPIGAGQVDLANCSVILVPALALDRAGARLGQGGGYFDRALGAIRPHANGGPLRIGMAFADEVVTRLPLEDHDQGVDLLLTEVGLIPAA